MTDERTIMIPKDPDQRAALAEFAGLTQEERDAIDVWCCLEQRKRDQGIVSAEEQGRA